MSTRPRMAFQGEHGAYSEQAAYAVFGNEIEPVPLASFDDVFSAVQDQTCAYGIVPIENSLAGSIHRNYDLLLRHDLFIIAERNLRICHCLIAHPGVDLGDIRQVYSHPQALAQCEHSLWELGELQIIATQDTAGSVHLIKEQKLYAAAAIAGQAAAELYGMSVLRSHLEDEEANYTRFLVLSTETVSPPGESKTSVAFAGKNEPGLLFRCISAFALRNIDLAKIESRPLRGVPWEYVFYLDFVGSLDDAACQRAIEQLREMASFVRVFGSYPRDMAAWARSEGD